MNEYQRALMGKPSIETAGCAICGACMTERHHIVPRSQGGADGPTVTLCGWGNTGGCHGLAHAHKLHLYDFGDGWQYLITKEPMKLEKAIEMGGWRHVKSQG